MAQPIRLIQAPKMATTATSNHLGQPHSHTPARYIAADVRKLATIRRPEPWYRSWYQHVSRWGQSNVRCRTALEALGTSPRPSRVPKGVDFISVLWGLTHLEGVNRGKLPASDHLFTPGALNPLPDSERINALGDVIGHGWEPDSLYSCCTAWFFLDHTGKLLIDGFVRVEDLEGLGVERDNCAPRLPDEPWPSWARRPRDDSFYRWFSRPDRLVAGRRMFLEVSDGG